MSDRGSDPEAWPAEQGDFAVKRIFAATVLTWLAFLISNGSAFAAPETSETFQFNYPGWQNSLEFSGSFTGTPESNGDNRACGYLQFQREVGRL